MGEGISSSVQGFLVLMMNVRHFKYRLSSTVNRPERMSQLLGLNNSGLLPPLFSIATALIFIKDPNVGFASSSITPIGALKNGGFKINIKLMHDS